MDAGEVEEEDEGERDEERLPGAVGGEGADRGALVARLEGDLRLWGSSIYDVRNLLGILDLPLSLLLSRNLSVLITVWF